MPTFGRASSFVTSKGAGSCARRPTASYVTLSLKIQPTLPKFIAWKVSGWVVLLLNTSRAPMMTLSIATTTPCSAVLGSAAVITAW